MSRKQGFTLLELAIVLTALALLAGATLGAQSMIRSSQMRSITSDTAKFTRAAVAFRDKYMAYPGDFAGATDLWGTDTGGCPGVYSANKGTKTCNGDGNGHIADYFLGHDQDYNEMFRAWQQMANAAMVEGSFSGRQGPDNDHHAVPGLNVAGSRIENAGFTLLYFDHPCDDASYWPSVYRHVLTIGSSLNSTITIGPTFSSAEVLAFDTKVDDGLPAYGNIMVAKPGLMPGCADNPNPTIAKYTGDSARTCGIIFKTGF
jgi:prepilin-type N-terminal cleavage/methylation domain-containing protein